MKPRFVSAVAMLFCAAIFAIVALFGYSRYLKAQADNAAFRAQMRSSEQTQQSALGARMPAQLPPRAGSAAVVNPEASPHPAQQ